MIDLIVKVPKTKQLLGIGVVGHGNQAVNYHKEKRDGKNEKTWRQKKVALIGAVILLQLLASVHGVSLIGKSKK
tara:strand:+ start:2251 stop:2472 length:222 start_codon:yes stop_codon:yes gene_type:complete